MVLGLLLSALVLAVATRLVVVARRTLTRFRAFSNLDREGIRYWLETLQDARTPGAYVIFEEMRRSDRSIQFRREVSATGSNLTCDFPMAPWSSEFISALRRMLTTRRLSHSDVPGREGEAVAGFISIPDLDTTAATDLTAAIFLELFQCESVNVKVWSFGLPSTERM